MKRSLLFSGLAIALVVVAFGAFIRDEGALAPHGRILKYRDPMDPTVFSDHAMEDSMGMDYIPVYADADPTPGPTAAPAPRRILKYRNPMDPTVFSDHPMKDNMGMDYIPVYAGEQAGAASAVPGRGAITLDAERSQMIGLQTQVAAVRPMLRTLRLPGRVGQGRGIILAQALEMDGPQLQAGQSARVLLPGRPPLAAKVQSVEQSLDAFSHTFGVRLALDGGPASFLRPGVYCEVDVALRLGRGLVVPRDAVLDNGERQWVFVDRGAGRLEPRLVTLGERPDDGVELLSGVEPGERVVTSGNFLVDSESSFQAAAQDFGGGGHD